MLVKVFGATRHLYERNSTVRTKKIVWTSEQFKGSPVTEDSRDIFLSCKKIFRKITEDKIFGKSL